MRNKKNRFDSLKSGNIQKQIARYILNFFLLLLLFNHQNAAAQNTTSLSISNKINYSVLIGFAVVFLGAAVYVLNYASKVLRENGKTIEFHFPIIRKMAYNGKTVAVLILIIVLAGIIWALKY